MQYVVDLAYFSWFSKNKELLLNMPVKCRDSGKVQALLFILKSLKKHVTFTVSARLCELHITDDDKTNDHRSVFCFPIRKMKNVAMKYKTRTTFIHFNDTFFSKMKFVDSSSNDFLNIMSEMSYSFIMPSQIQKYYIPFKKIYRYHNKILMVCDSNNKFQGLIKIDVRKYGATYCPIAAIKEVQNKFVDLPWIITKLKKENLPKTSAAGSKFIYQSPVARFFHYVQHCTK